MMIQLWRMTLAKAEKDQGQMMKSYKGTTFGSQIYYMQIIVLEDHDRKKYCDYVNLKVSKMIAAKFVFFVF